MAKLTKLPSLDIIRGFKGVIDFYHWKGIPCARAWPRFRPQNWTAPSRASAALFGLIIKAWALTGAAAKDLYTQDAADQPRHARDIYVSAVLGHLHEASMTDFLTLLTECRDFLSNLTALLNALNSVGTDQLDVIVQASALPTGAATAAAQATQLTALQKIDDLQNALQSLGTDRILIRGQDQVFSLKDTLEKWAMFVETADQWWVATPPVPTAELWLVTTSVQRNDSTATTEAKLSRRSGTVTYPIHTATQAIAMSQQIPWSGLAVLKQGDTLRAEFTGSQIGDVLRIYITGYTMTKE